jgi:hypothetical protein
MNFVGRDSVVGIETCYALEGLGIEIRWGEIFLTSPARPWANPACNTMGTGLFRGEKRAGRGVDKPPPSSDEVKERVELYLYYSSGPLRPVLGETIPFTS